MSTDPSPPEDQDAGTVPGDEQVDEQVDEAELESFPASDPPSSWAGRDDVRRDPTGPVDTPEQR